MTEGTSVRSLTPFLKWAGGKRWLVEKQDGLELFPGSFGTYIEPFLGSGAVFFNLNPERAILSDLNGELIDTYIAIRDDWKSVWEKLQAHNRRHSKDYYYKVRASKPYSLSGRAAKFIYLNRTCYNGLYRVNLKGEFNVPIGTKSAAILSTDNFEAISESLRKTKIVKGDFESVIDASGKNDFVFVDPPYTVKHNLNGFVKYNENLFSWEDQIRLKDSVIKAKRRGALVVVLNANHESIRDLYRGESMQVLDRSSVISANKIFRGTYSELAIKCW